jgi:hypothetical protein
MFSDDTRKKLENIVRGVLINGQEDHCTAARNFLCAGFSTSTTVKSNFESQLLIKEEQTKCLREYSTTHDLWISHLPTKNQFIAKGGESKVFLDTSQKHVIKINDAVYYATWLEFFNSLILHNLIFKDTNYTFQGFAEIENVLHAVVRQPFIVSDGQADLKDIQAFLKFNGFENTRRQDYFNEEYGLILEDMHDENVILKSEKLFFIDTVFYTVFQGNMQPF